MRIESLNPCFYGLLVYDTVLMMLTTWKPVCLNPCFRGLLVSNSIDKFMGETYTWKS